MRQAHVLYGGPPAAGSFDLHCEVYQGQLMPSAETATLAAQEGGPAGTQEGEAEARGEKAGAEEGECVEIEY